MLIFSPRVPERLFADLQGEGRGAEVQGDSTSRFARREHDSQSKVTLFGYGIETDVDPTGP